jgi:hypothetical protein
LADALIGLERDREHARRAEQAQTGTLLNRNASEVGSADLLAVGLAMVWKLLD